MQNIKNLQISKTTHKHKYFKQNHRFFILSYLLIGITKVSININFKNCLEKYASLSFMFIDYFLLIPVSDFQSVSSSACLTTIYK